MQVFSQQNHKKGKGSYRCHFCVAKPSKKVMEVVVFFFFAKIKPKKKVTTHCRYLLHFKKN
jgi:hypothetical protein